MKQKLWFYLAKLFNKSLVWSHKTAPDVHRRLLATAIKRWPKVDLGGHKTRYHGWIALDLNQGVDLVSDPLDFIEDASLTHVMSHHFLEHIEFEQAVDVINKVKRKMKPGATLRIAVPDKFDRENERSLMAHGHVFAWSYLSARELAEQVNMKLHLIHYCDEAGNFHEDRTSVQKWEIDEKKQELVTENGFFQIIRGTGRINSYGGVETTEHSLFFDLVKENA